MDSDELFKRIVSIALLCITIISFIVEVLAYKFDWGLKVVLIACAVFILSLILFISSLMDPDNYREDDGGWEGGAFF